MWKVGSLFSGIGGIELGFERAGGFETAWFVECEPYAQAVLRKHWPNVPIYGDIREIDFTTLPKVDILTGGFPCQDISNAGKRKGITGERSGLWKEYLRAICEIRPKIVFVENVAALVNRGLDVVLRDLAQAGYDAEWFCLSAADVGAPHKRQRIWIIAHSDGNSQSVMSFNGEQGCGKLGKNVADNSNKGISTWRRGNDFDNEKESESWGINQSGSRSNDGVFLESSEDGKKSKVADCDFGFPSGSVKSGFVEGESKKEISGRSGVVSFSDYYYWEQRKKGFFEKNRETTWATDTGILRVASGIPFRVDRIKCLGNSVVPQCSEVFAEIIKEKLERAENENEKVK